MKAGFKVCYYNSQYGVFTCLHVWNEHTTNEVRLRWHYDESQKYAHQTGVWKIKRL